MKPLFTFAAVAIALLTASAVNAKTERDTSWKAVKTSTGSKMCPALYTDDPAITEMAEQKPEQIVSLKASWYGNQFHGRPMSNGDTFHECDATVVAYNKLPKGTVLRLTNKDNGKKIYVIVQDRGGPHMNRRLDLSRGAAQALDPAYNNKGILNLKVEILGKP